MRSEIMEYMTANREDNVDSETCEINATQLAEDTAWALGHAEWLDDETHVVWDIAVEVSQRL